MIDRTEIELRRFAAPPGKEPPGFSWHGHAARFLEKATAAFADGDHDKAWELVLDARRSMVPLLTPDEKAALAISLSHQNGKADRWRQDAIATLLLPPGPGEVPADAYLAEALLHLDVIDANNRRAHHSRRDELLAAVFVLMVTLGVVLGTLIVGAGLDLKAVSFGNLKLVVLVQCFGILGACFSAIERTTKRVAKRVPDERAAKFATWVRLATGAAAGLLALAAGQSNIIGDQPGAVLLAAFAAGFSERFVLKLLPSGTAETPLQTPPQSSPPTQVPSPPSGRVGKTP